ncbi:outer membrane beta-barrel protein [Fluoribacter gormanii]|uniref:outer membrane protein n=1 Tax=Fluoribacter gormanii TaxID=464 RepID=UPI002244EE54|nr:outer membrane beta-barrel protein [Fluoribacter gormanii]MCW8471309.1 outer membrane beta-barrel protein [Fluoribacter gormanii]
MKALLLGLGLGIIPACTLANGLADNSDHFSGFYLGGALGGLRISTDQSLVFNPKKVANVSKYNANLSESSTNPLGQITAGYGRKFHIFYIAGELIAEITNAEIKRETPNLKWNMKQKSAFGGRVKSGITLEKWLLYGLAGVETVRIGHHVDFIRGGTYNSGTMFLDAINTNKNTTVWQLGLGVDYSLNTHWVAQVEYAHNFYNNHANSNIDHRIITFNNPKGIYSSSLSGNEITVGVKYLFC